MKTKREAMYRAIIKYLFVILLIIPIFADNYYSEYQQDEFLNKNTFHGKKEGVFVDIGAYDGILASNTYFFEKNLGWTGICVEPLDNAYANLIKNRKCICVHGAVSACAEIRDFVEVHGRIPTFSGFLNTYHKKHWSRVNTILEKQSHKWSIIKVKTFTFNDLCKKYKLNHIDYLSIDTEGSEEEIIKSIDFKNIDINVIDIENNYGNTTMRHYLESNGYKFITHLKIDDIYVKN